VKSSKASQERHFTRPVSQHLLLLRDERSPTSPTRILSTSGESVGQYPNQDFAGVDGTSRRGQFLPLVAALRDKC
jgi:hypothetical protein